MALQACIEGQDWESVARHCARAMAIPPEIISGPFAESVVVSIVLSRILLKLSNLSKPTAEFHLPPDSAGRER